jgi:hypothetical protein
MKKTSLSTDFWIISSVIVLIAVNSLWWIQYSALKEKYASASASSAVAAVNSQVLDFTAMFVDKVLGAKGDIDFDTRLALENGVRNLKDADVLNAWQAFVNSKTEADAQSRARDLLSVLVKKIQSPK